MASFEEWFHQAAAILAASPEFKDDVQLTLKFLLESRTGKRFSILQYTKQDLLVNIDTLNNDVKALANGVPLAYVLGEWSFYGLDFIITPAVLIPRPETELLVEEALTFLQQKSGEHKTVLDIGTGSGIIAITIAKLAINITVIASDISQEALKICNQNIKKHHVENNAITVLADGVPPFQHKVDLLCANLPYIPAETVDTLHVTKHEPRLALDGGIDGLQIIADVLRNSTSIMKPSSMLLFEIEERQGKSSSILADQFYPHSKISIIKDLAGKDRLLRIENQ